MGGRACSRQRLRSSLKPTIFGSTFAPDALETEEDAFGKGGAVFSIIPRRIRERLVFRLVRCDECGLARTEAHRGGAIRNEGPLQSITAKC